MCVSRVRVDDSATTSQTFYELLMASVHDPGMSLVSVRLEGNPLDVQSLLSRDNGLTIAGACGIVPVGRCGVAAIVRTMYVVASLAAVDAQMQAYSLVRAGAVRVIVSSIAGGKDASVNAWIEAVADDTLRQCREQGIETGHERAILTLQPGRLTAQRRYDRGRKRYEVCREVLRSRQRSNYAVRAGVDRLIAGVDHDLRSGLRLLREETRELLEEYGDGAVGEDTETLRWLDGHITICEAWKRRIAELGSGSRGCPVATEIGAASGDIVSLLRQQLGLSCDVSIDIPEGILVTCDPEIMLVTWLSVLLAGEAAGATMLDCWLATSDESGMMILIFEDDGAVAARRAALESRGEIVDGVPWEIGLVGLLADMLQTHSMGWTWVEYDDNHHERLQLFWEMPRYQAPPAPSIIPFEELGLRIEHIEREIARCEAEIDRIDAAREEVACAVIHHLLAPHVAELERHANVLVECGTRLVGLGATDERVHRLRRISSYCALLVRNLVVAVRGGDLPLERIDINEQIRTVVDLLEHRIGHLQVILDLADWLPRVELAAIEAQQMFMNILKNAVEATGPNDMVRISTHVAGGMVIVRVRDSGIGIPPEYGDKVAALHFSTKGAGENSGVGLYTVGVILSRVGGMLRMASRTYSDEGTLVGWSRGFDEDGGMMNHTWEGSGTLMQLEFPVCAMTIADMEHIRSALDATIEL